MNFVSIPQAIKLKGLALHAGSTASGRLLCAALDLQCAPGERWALLGPNGAGKSTLLATLAGLLPVLQGEVRLGEKGLQQIAVGELARVRAWCPQFWFDPFPVSAWESVACAVTATRPELDAAAVRTLALDWLTRFDVAGLSDTDVRVLSGGERQRIALATASAQGAPLLLLDEPTAHLDWAHQALFVARMRRWSEAGGLVLAAVHDLNLAWAFATHVVLLDGRGGVRCGMRDEVMQADVLAKVYGVRVDEYEAGQEKAFKIGLNDEQ